MPLSSLWASSSVDNRRRISPNPGADRLQPEVQGASRSGLLLGDQFLNEQPDVSNTMTSKSDDSNHRSPDGPHDKHFSFDLEAQGLPKTDSGKHGRVTWLQR